MRPAQFCCDRVVEVLRVLALAIKSLGCAREGQLPGQVRHSQVRRDFNLRFIKVKITTLANALFEQKTNV